MTNLDDSWDDGFATAATTAAALAEASSKTVMCHKTGSTSIDTKVNTSQNQVSKNVPVKTVLQPVHKNCKIAMYLLDNKHFMVSVAPAGSIQSLCARVGLILDNQEHPPNKSDVTAVCFPSERQAVFLLAFYDRVHRAFAHLHVRPIPNPTLTAIRKLPITISNARSVSSLFYALVNTVLIVVFKLEFMPLLLTVICEAGSRD